MDNQIIPKKFYQLMADEIISDSDILKTDDNFFVIYKSLSDILLKKSIIDFPDSEGVRLKCDNFFDDWFLYAVPSEDDFVYSLLKMREQEFDALSDTPADGDTPGVTISFIAFNFKMLLDCLDNSTDLGRQKLNEEINRVVAYKGQKHHKDLKKYFINPKADGSYLVAALYTKHIAAFSKNGSLELPEYYKEIVRQSVAYKDSSKKARLPRYIENLNKKAGYAVCDNEKIYIKNSENPSEYECAAILATHTANTSTYSFAAEVEYHAKFLFSLAKIKIPFFGKSIYDSAIRADLTIGDTEFEGPAPFHREDSNIVKRQYKYHQNFTDK